jgi:hypothetical protein
MDSLELGIAALMLTGNVIIVWHALRAGMVVPALVFYAIWLTGLFVLPGGIAQWFWLAVWAAAAIRSGRLLVRMQEQAVAR